MDLFLNLWNILKNFLIYIFVRYLSHSLLKIHRKLISAYLLCDKVTWRFSTDFDVRPGVKMYRLTSMLCQTLSLSYFGRLCVPSRIKYWRLFNHCFSRVWWTWRRSSILDSYTSEKLVFFLGLDSSCLIEQSNELMNDRSDTTQMINDAWM
jgi:hypothetical protein